MSSFMQICTISARPITLIKTQFPPLFYFEGEGLIRSQALGVSIGGKVSITHEGIVEVEEAITNPQVN
jgi:hypothetical protein